MSEFSETKKTHAGAIGELPPEVHEIGKKEVSFDRQVAVCGKKDADAVLYFWLLGYEYAVNNMPAQPADLLSQLKRANRERCPVFDHGGIEGWSLERWAVAVAGETGELCNEVKKVIRGDYDEKQPHEINKILGDEAADIVIYLDMLCQRMGIDLREVIARKFNAVSVKKESPVYIEADEQNYTLRMLHLERIREGALKFFTCDHNEHIHSRLNDQESEAVDAMKSGLISLGYMADISGPEDQAQAHHHGKQSRVHNATVDAVRMYDKAGEKVIASLPFKPGCE